MIVRFICALLLPLLSISAGSRLQDALELESKGKLKESRDMFRAAAGDLRSSHDQRGLARALSASARISVSLGDYRAAIQDASAAIVARRALGDETGLNEDFNTVGLANLYLANYDEALDNYQKALALDRAHRDAEGEVARQNNIGNVFYFRGRYLDALRSYQQAMEKIDASGGEPWIPWRRQLTIANLATLYQRLGKEQAALEQYQQLTGKSQAMPRTEYAQLLLNEGVLYRRLGDPVKALEQYRAARTIFATDRHSAGEIGALRNIGIARGVDLGDLPGALDAFTRALELARESSDTRGIVQASLYRGEVLRRLDRMTEAENDFRVALEGAERTGLAEEQWKALYGLGKVEEAAGRPDAAADLYGRAIARIESVRAGLRLAGLRSEFLADKRDVYDSLIALALRKSPAPVEEIFSLLERSRARNFQEQSRSAAIGFPSIRRLQARMPRNTLLLDFWIGAEMGVTVWITNSAAGVVALDAGAARIQNAVSRFERAIQDGNDAWKILSRPLGASLLPRMAAGTHLIVVPDGPLNVLPFELLTDPASGALLIEKSDVSYLPAARFLAQPPPARSNLLPPWRTQLVAFGDPPLALTDTLAAAERWQRMPAAGREIREIAHILPGRSDIHLGSSARKHEVFGGRLQGASLLHFSTHAVVDAENPDRSRILMAGDSPAAPFDYIFQQEVYGLDLRNFDLVTVAACDTARGKTIPGEGLQAFSQAFLAAGAGATITSLWRVPDASTAEFMKQLYYFLGRGQSKAEALRSAKLQFLHSRETLNAPRYWAAFILNGDGWNSCARVIPWTYLIAGMGAALLAAGLLLRRREARTRAAAVAH